ncbi:MAG: hypothetical protein IJ187_09840 [Neisseriaceae bacterium]|nr:hypothetical protein [Neisseriaceae bacterium]
MPFFIVRRLPRLELCSRLAITVTFFRQPEKITPTKYPALTAYPIASRRLIVAFGA